MKDRLDTTLSDEALVGRFFAEHTEALPDNGFSRRTLDAMHQAGAFAVDEDAIACRRLRRIRLALNIIGLAAVLMIVLRKAVFATMASALTVAARHILSALSAFDTDALLVQVMLALHRLPAILPTPTQLAALVLTTLVLLHLGLTSARKTTS